MNAHNISVCKEIGKYKLKKNSTGDFITRGIFQSEARMFKVDITTHLTHFYHSVP